MIKIKDGDCEFCGKENCNCYAISVWIVIRKEKKSEEKNDCCR